MQPNCLSSKFQLEYCSNKRKTTFIMFLDLLTRFWNCCHHSPSITKISSHSRLRLFLSLLVSSVVFYNISLAVVKVFFAHENITKEEEVECHSQSLDLYLIEHMWALVKRKSYEYPTPTKGMLQLWEHIQVFFHCITPKECQKFHHSMPSRIQVVMSIRTYLTRQKSK